MPEIANRVLIIDDEIEFAKFVERVAIGLGFEVHVSPHADDFKRAVEEFDPDQIVLDIVMPMVDGIELVNWLASVKSRARVILVTGYDPSYARMGEVMARAKGLSLVEVRQKPIMLADLRALLSAN